MGTLVQLDYAVGGTVDRHEQSERTYNAVGAGAENGASIIAKAVEGAALGVAILALLPEISPRKVC
jgi:hypothetical protein